MADILLFSKARKTRAKADKEATAAENRVKFGRTKAEKSADAAKKALAEKSIDAHKRGD
jgi:hypothetical protein